MKKLTIGFICLSLFAIFGYVAESCASHKEVSAQVSEHKTYNVISYPTPNIGKGTNKVKGIVLHHTECPTLQSALDILCGQERQVSCHVVIDTDGTRYVLAPPTAITWHAGYSRLNGKEHCNQFMLGIELQGNTNVAPLTDDQIHSAIEYMLPLMKEYHIPLKNIKSHMQVRQAYLDHHPGSTVPDKDDISNAEYERFMDSLKVRLK